MSLHREPEQSFEEHVGTRYRLYAGLFLGLPYHLLQRVGRLLPVFTEHCRKGLQQKESPSAIVERFFAENPSLTDVSQDDAIFLFLQLIERQVVLFDALEMQSEREAWLQENKEAIDAKIERGLAQLDRGEGIPRDQIRGRLEADKVAWLRDRSGS